MKKATTEKTSKSTAAVKVVKPDLLKDITFLIEKTTTQVAYNVNSSMVIQNWHIGKRIRKEILKNKRAEYGERIVATLSQQLTNEYGEGYTKSALNRMLAFARYYPTSHQRTAISKRPKALIQKELKRQVSTKEITNSELVFKDPYLLDFPGLKDTYILQLEKSNIKVSEYLTALPPKKVLERKLHQAIVTAQKNSILNPNKQ